MWWQKLKQCNNSVKYEVLTLKYPNVATLSKVGQHGDEYQQPLQQKKAKKDFSARTPEVQIIPLLTE